MSETEPAGTGVESQPETTQPTIETNTDPLQTPPPAGAGGKQSAGGNRKYTSEEVAAIGLLAAYFLIAIVFNLIFLLETVPIDISTKTEDGKEVVVNQVTYKSTPGSLVTRLIGSPIDVNTHLTLIVIFAGSLGGLIHGLASLAYHAEKCDFKLKRILWFVVRPLSVASIAFFAFYLTKVGLGRRWRFPLTYITLSIFLISIGTFGYLNYVAI